MHSLLILLSIIVITFSVSIAYAQVPSNYPGTGIQIGENNTILTKYIPMHGYDTLTILVESLTLNLTSKTLTVAVSPDNTTYYTADMVSLGDVSLKSVYYADGNFSSDLPINPAAWPFVKLTLPALGVNITGQITWTSGH